MSGRRRSTAGVIGCSLLSGLLAVPAGHAAADMIDDGSMKPWETCALCHSLDGVSRMAKFPKLAGQPAAYIAKQLADFRTGRRDNDRGQMEAMATTLSGKEVDAVAGYFAGLPPPPTEPARKDASAAAALASTGDPARGMPACFSCHAAGRTADSGAPRLEAQHPAYIEKQLRDFREGRRRNDPAGAMQAVAAALRPQEIPQLAAYFGALTRN